MLNHFINVLNTDGALTHYPRWDNVFIIYEFVFHVSILHFIKFHIAVILWS